MSTYSGDRRLLFCRTRRRPKAARYAISAAVMFMIGAAQSSAQDAPPLHDVAHPRVAVVLSGGTAKAIADIGVLEVLEQLGVPIDAVTGTSMGAIMGGLYSAGYSPHALENIIDHENWSTFFTGVRDRRLQTMYEKLEDERLTIKFPLVRARPILPEGALSRQSIAAHLDRYLWPIHDVTDFMSLPTPFGALVTDLATGDAVLLQRGSLSQAIQGSSAVPGAFAPVKLADGRLVVDGAVNRNIPAEDARRLGADMLICVDVSERVLPVDGLHSLIDVVDQTVAIRVQLSNAIQRPLCTVIIEPDIKGLSSTAFSDGKQWVNRGRAAALAHQSELLAIADSARRLRGSPVPRRTIPPSDSVFVRKILLSTVSPGADAIAEGAMTLEDSTWVTQQDAEDAAARLFATGRFDQVSYRVVASDNSHDLIFDLTEGNRDQLGVGVRYDTPYGAAVLVNTQVSDFVSPGSTSSLSARLGAIQQFAVQDVLGEGANAKFLQTYRVTSTRMVLPNILGVPTPPRLSVQQVLAHMERPLVSGIVVGLELSHDWSRDGADGINGLYTLRARSFNRIAATISRDNLDRVLFPTRGTAVFWRSEFGTSSFRDSGRVTRHILDAQGAFPIIRHISLTGTAHLGTVTGIDLPLHDLFFLGGSVQSEVWRSQFVPFPGLDPQSVVGRSVQVFSGGVQADMPAQFIAELHGSIGNVFNAVPHDSSERTFRRGVALSVSHRLPPGPVSLSLATQSWRQRPVVEIAFGARF